MFRREDSDGQKTRRSSDVEEKVSKNRLILMNASIFILIWGW